VDHSDSLTDRAIRAARRARDADPDLFQLTPDSVEWRMRGHHARTVAALLGIDPAAVVVTDDPIRRTGRYPAYLITVHDDTEAGGGRVACRFIPEPGVDGTYLLLQQCPACSEGVPRAAVASLVDLGRTMVGDDNLSTTFERWDAGHRPHCPRADPTG